MVQIVGLGALFREPLVASVQYPCDDYHSKNNANRNEALVRLAESWLRGAARRCLGQRRICLQVLSCEVERRRFIIDK